MLSYRESVSNEYITAVSRRFPEMDVIELEKLELAFKAGFDAGTASNNELAETLFMTYFSNLFKEEV
jgi:hypothetical protein